MADKKLEYEDPLNPLPSGRIMPDGIPGIDTRQDNADYLAEKGYTPSQDPDRTTSGTAMVFNGVGINLENADLKVDGDSVATKLKGLADVDVITTPPTDQQALVFDEEIQKWVPGEAVGGSSGGACGPFTDLGDIVIGAVTGPLVWATATSFIETSDSYLALPTLTHISYTGLDKGPYRIYYDGYMYHSIAYGSDLAPTTYLYYLEPQTLAWAVLGTPTQLKALSWSVDATNLVSLATLPGPAWLDVPIRHVCISDDGVTIKYMNNYENYTIAATWTDIITTVGVNKNDVIWGDGEFVICGEDGVIMFSPDGIEWDHQYNGADDEYHSIIYDSVANRYVAVGTAANGTESLISFISTSTHLELTRFTYVWDNFGSGITRVSMIDDNTLRLDTATYPNIYCAQSGSMIYTYNQNTSLWTETDITATLSALSAETVLGVDALGDIMCVEGHWILASNYTY